MGFDINNCVNILIVSKNFEFSVEETYHILSGLKRVSQISEKLSWSFKIQNLQKHNTFCIFYKTAILI